MKALTYIVAIVQTVSIGAAHAQQEIGIDYYHCEEFLSDSLDPEDVDAFMRPLITIAWATGFAAAHQQNDIRADDKAMQVIAGIAGNACRENPESLVVDAVVSVIGELVEKRQ